MTAMPPRLPVRKSSRPMNTSTTYTLAHTVQCKLKIAAGRPDRNLRFVLGHAFTLDNLMLRIVEIENKSAKSQFDEADMPLGNENYDCAAPAKSEPKKAEVMHNDGRGRRISFQDNNARPSSIGFGTVGVSSNNSEYHNKGTSSPARKRSPPPTTTSPRKLLEGDSDDDDTSSDDYEEPDGYQYGNAKKPKTTSAAKESVQPPPREAAHSDEEDDDDIYEDDDFGEDMGGGLTRFESASAQPPRMVRSTSSSEDEDEDDDGPVTPPQLPADVDLADLLAGEQDKELGDLYESVRGCRCHGHSQDPDAGRKAHGVWDVPMEKSPEGKRLVVVAVEALADEEALAHEVAVEA